MAKKKVVVPVAVAAPMMDDALIKDIRNADAFSQLGGFHQKGFAALLHYMFNLKESKTPKATSSVMAAWSGLEDAEQDNLGEILSKRQIVYIGLAALSLKHRPDKDGALDTLRKMFGKDEDSD